MERLTGRETAIVLEEKAKSLEAQGITPHTRELEYIALAKYENAIEDGELLPVKRGKWETWGYIFEGIEWLRCSRCGKPADVSYFKLLEGKIEPATLSICGCCGADMEQNKI